MIIDAILVIIGIFIGIILCKIVINKSSIGCITLYDGINDVRVSFYKNNNLQNVKKDCLAVFDVRKEKIYNE